MFCVQTSSGNLHEMALASSQAGRVLAQPLSHRQILDMRTLNTLVKSQRNRKPSPLGKWLLIMIYIKFTDKWQCCVGIFSHFDLFSGYSFTVTKLMWQHGWPTHFHLTDTAAQNLLGNHYLAVAICKQDSDSLWVLNEKSCFQCPTNWTGPGERG